MSRRKESGSTGRRPIELPLNNGLLSQLALEYAISRGMTIEKLLIKAGLRTSPLNETHSRMSWRSQSAFVNLVASASADDALGFHLAQIFDVRRIGALYYLVASTESLADAMEAISHYGVALGEHLQFYKFPGAPTIYIENAEAASSMNQHQVEFWATSLLRLFRLFAGREIAPNYVNFSHRREGDVPEMEQYFGCPLYFGATKDEISFDRQMSGLPNSMSIAIADPLLRRILTDYLESITVRSKTDRASARNYVENAIANRLPNGDATITHVAADLGMSARTLARRLAEEGLTFSSVLEGLRLDLAQRYLRDDELSISQIAWRLGYAEVSSFIHAFQRWTGKSPSSARRQMSMNGGSEVGGT